MTIDTTPHADLTGTDIHPIPAYTQSGDPGAVGAGKVWHDTDDDKVYMRNDADSGWIELTGGGGAIDYAEAGDLVAVAFGDTADAGASDEVPRADHRHAAPANPVTAHDAGFNHAAHASRHNDGGADALAEDQAAGTASLRTLGTGAAQAAAGNHSHTGLPLDFGESGDIVAVAFGDTAAAGATGEIADAGHRHAAPANPVTGLVHTINIVIDGGGGVIATGIKADFKVDFACTVTEWTIIADQSGSIVVDLWKDTYANYPPVVGDSMTTSEKPTLSSASKNQDTSLNGGAGWSIAAGSIIRPNVDSATTVTRVTIALKVTRT